MTEREVESLEGFALKVILLANLFSWWMFFAVVTFPLTFLAGLLIHIFLMSFSVALGFGAVITFLLLDRLILKEKFRFWIDAEMYKPYLNALYFVFSGGICAAFLLWWGLYLLFGPSVIDNYWPGIVLTTILIPSIFLVIWHLVMRVGKKKKRVSRKCFFGKKADVEKMVMKALDSLKMKHYEAKEGSHWTGFVPVLKIEGSDISINVSQRGIKQVSVAIVAKTPDDVLESREIEKRIDSYFNVEGQHDS